MTEQAVDCRTGEILESRALLPFGERALAPQEILTKATEVADILASIIKKRKLYVVIKDRKHVLFEAWTTLGALTGQVLGDAVFPVTIWSRPIEGGFEARVEARTYSGALVGAAEAQCTRAEANWKGRDDYALRSMAQTRAGSKALKMPLGWIMQLAGFESTPADEMETGATKASQASKPAAASPAASGILADKERDALFGLAQRAWPNRAPHTVICQALNLPEIGEGALATHWLGRGGSWPQAQTSIAEVRRLEVGGMPLQEAIEKVNAYGQLSEQPRQPLEGLA